MARSEVKHPFQVYLGVPIGIEANLVTALIADCALVAAVLLYAEEQELSELVVREYVAAAHSQSIPLIVSDDPGLAKAAGADGVHIPANEARYAASRALLGADAIVGAACATSRHDALVLAEEGADYVSFASRAGAADTENIGELVKWWQEVCEPAVVGWHHGDWGDVAALVSARPDFIGVAGLIWEAEDPTTALHRLSSLIAKQQ